MLFARSRLLYYFTTISLVLTVSHWSSVRTLLTISGSHHFINTLYVQVDSYATLHLYKDIPSKMFALFLAVKFVKGNIKYHYPENSFSCILISQCFFAQVDNIIWKKNIYFWLMIMYFMNIFKIFSLIHYIIYYCFQLP